MQFAIPFDIRGEIKIEADSPEEALRIFRALNVREIAVEGELESYDPEPRGGDAPPREELPNCIWRGAATPFADNH
jgi:hypothetical protein